MKISEKIKLLRERSEMTQEELAFRAGVSWRTVLRWETGKLTPTIDQIVLLSKIFEISTDALIKDESGLDKDAPAAPREKVITHAVAKAYLDLKYRYAELIALATLLFILSPAVLIILGSLPSVEGLTATLIGIGALLFLFSAAIGIYVYAYQTVEGYEYIEKEETRLDYSATDLVASESEECRKGYFIQNVTALIICALSFIPLIFTALFFGGNEKASSISLVITLSLAGIGVVLFINSGIRRSAVEALLENKKKKSEYSKRLEALIGRIIWTVGAVIYVILGFMTHLWVECLLVFFFALCIKAIVSACFAIIRRDGNIHDN